VPAYASLDGLGQSFNFDLLNAPWDAAKFRAVVTENLELSASTGSSSTWVMSNHDVIRHASRLMIPNYGEFENGFDENLWYVTNRLDPQLDIEEGLARATAATLFILALPGSTYIYQGEELGLPDYLQIPHEQMQDPQWFRGEGKLKSRDGCRVPLPWSSDKPNYGFSQNLPHLPQPDWFKELAVDAQERDPQSTLNLYRRAIEVRRNLETAETLEWLDSPANSLIFRRPNGWVCAINFGANALALPQGEVLISSKPLSGGKVAPVSSVWLKQN
jgi:alpha-glucosidase